MSSQAQGSRPDTAEAAVDAAVDSGVDSGVDAVVDANVDDALGSDDAVGLVVRLAAREVSPAELRAASLARAEAVNGRLNAVSAWVADPYRSEVEVPADAPFAGVPSLIKDNEALAGYPTTDGSWASSPLAAPACSPWVAQYLGLGFVPVAKTTLPEFGLTASTESLRFGATRNPWHTAHSAGGSSGGSAAFTAAGVVPIAHANDGGGSIRIPASCNGLVGLKPSRGRLVDLPELARLPVALTVQGVVTRTVRDTAHYYAEAEKVYRNDELPPIGLVRGPGTDRLRVGLLATGIRDLPVDADTVAAVRATGTLLEGLGHHVQEATAPVDDDFGPDFLRYWAALSFLIRYAGGRLYGEGFDGSRCDPFTTGLARMFRDQALRFPGSLRRLRRLAIEHEDYSQYDVLVSPVLGHEPPPIGYLGPDVPFRTHLVRLLRYASFTPVQNVSGSPAISLPLGRSARGLPIGVQVAAPFGHERRLLEVAFELEQAAPWPTRTRTAG